MRTQHRSAGHAGISGRESWTAPSSSDVTMYPEPGRAADRSQDRCPPATIIAISASRFANSPGQGPVETVGAGFPGVIRGGVIQESPNLGQLKGLHMADDLRAALKAGGIDVPVVRHQRCRRAGRRHRRHSRDLDDLVRVWYLGDGIGFGRYPHNDGVWEAGHMVVTLDPKERYCGCGGIGHLEGIMGHRAMRLRFLDMEPEEVFAAARHGDHARRRVHEAVASRARRRLPPPASTSMARAASISPARMPISSICACSAATCRTWSR